MFVASNLSEYAESADAILPPPMEIESLAEEATLISLAEGGATINLYFGNLAGTPLFSVSVFPDRSVVLEEEALMEGELRLWILGYVIANQILLRDPRCSVGVWHGKDGLIYLDVTVTVSSKKKALKLGAQYNQLAVFDLKRLDSLDTKGDGSSVANLPPPLERLPPMARDREE